MPSTLASTIATSLATLFTLSILWVTIAGLLAKRDLSDPWGPNYTTTIDPADLGIDKVSGLYGPGVWAAWLFAVMACCLAQIYGKRRDETRRKWFNFRGIDTNFVCAYGYPVTATVDFL